MGDESTDKTVEAPPEAHDPSLSSNAKDDFFADAPQGTPPPVTNAVADEAPDAPERHKHRSYDVKARNSTEEDADFEADSEAEGNAEEEPNE